MRDDRAAGTRSGVRQTTPGDTTGCDRRGPAPSAASGAAVKTGPSLYGGGSGPGDYGRYVPGAPPAGAPGQASAGAAPAAATTPATAGDRPLYGGNDRPLWSAGQQPRTPVAGPRGKAGSPAEAAAERDPGDATTPQPNALPAPVRDRPLWAEKGLSGLADPEPQPAPGLAPNALPGLAQSALPSSPCPATAAAPLPR